MRTLYVALVVLGTTLPALAQSDAEILAAKGAYEASESRLRDIETREKAAAAANQYKEAGELFFAKRAEWKVCAEGVVKYNSLVKDVPPSTLARLGVPDRQSTIICK